MARTSTLRRTSIFFDNAISMKRLTNIFGPGDDAPKEPEDAEALSFLALSTAKPTNASALSLSLAVPTPGDINGPGGPLTPTSTSPQSPLAPPPSLPYSPTSSPGGFRPGSRPGSAGTGGLMVPGAVPAAQPPPPPEPMPAEFPRQTKKKRKTSRLSKKKKEEDQMVAWRLLASGSSEHLEQYDVGPLVRGEQSQELWYPEGDTLVYFTARDHSKSKNTSPVFRIHSSPLMFSALGSYIEYMNPSDQPGNAGQDVAHNDLFLEVPVGPQDTSDDSQPQTQESVAGSENSVQRNATIGSNSSRAESSTRQVQSPSQDSEASIMYKVLFPVLGQDKKSPGSVSSPPRKSKLSKDLKHRELSKSDAEDTLQRFIDARNLFAFLDRNFLVATHAKEMPFEILAKIFESLQLHKVDTLGMSTEVKFHMAENHLQTYVEDLTLDDIRNDDDAIIEAIILGERWRSVRLYTEGFLHACGRWEDIKNHPGWAYVSKVTKSRIDRNSINLHQIRVPIATTRITNFDFPSVWVGDGRYKEFSGWRNAFDRLRSHTLSYYKSFYGSWPPRPGKHGKGGGYTVTGGLNRVVLQQLYLDFAYLYDLIVDREWLHGERIHFDGTGGSDDEKDEESTKQDRLRKTMRKVMSEFDTSNVPVQPTMPFDLPRLPYRLPSPTSKSKKKAKSLWRSSKKVSGEEMAAILNYSYNQDALQAYGRTNPFIASFIQHERDFGSGKTIEDSMDARRGRWIFMYCILQSLPMLVVDGTGLRYGEGVEYFLCENVKGILPWERGRTNNRTSRLSGLWTFDENGEMMGPGMTTGVNPDDEIEMTFRRSHCWVVAEDWRLVKATEEDEEEYYDDWSPEMEGYSNDYVSGQEVPSSPGINTYPDQQATEEFRGLQLSDGSYSAEFVNQQDVDQQDRRYSPPGTIRSSQNSGPAWAEEARANYYSQPQYQTAQGQQYGYQQQQHYPQMRSASGTSQMSYGSHTRMSSRMSGAISSRSSSLPNTPQQLNSDPMQQSNIKPLQLQPFEFDLKPLDVSKVSPVQSPRQGSKPGSPMISPVVSPMSPRRMEPPRLSPTESLPNRSPPVASVQSPTSPKQATGPLISPITQSPVSMSPEGSPMQSPKIGFALSDQEAPSHAI